MTTQCFEMSEHWDTFVETTARRNNGTPKQWDAETTARRNNGTLPSHIFLQNKCHTQ